MNKWAVSIRQHITILRHSFNKQLPLSTVCLSVWPACLPACLTVCLPHCLPDYLPAYGHLYSVAKIFKTIPWRRFDSTRTHTHTHTQTLPK